MAYDSSPIPGNGSSISQLGTMHNMPKAMTNPWNSWLRSGGGALRELSTLQQLGHSAYVFQAELMVWRFEMFEDSWCDGLLSKFSRLKMLKRWLSDANICEVLKSSPAPPGSAHAPPRVCQCVKLLQSRQARPHATVSPRKSITSTILHLKKHKIWLICIVNG